mgnify:CR=1 FL=1
MLRLSDEAETGLNLANPGAAGKAAVGGCLMIVGFEGDEPDVDCRDGYVSARLIERKGFDGVYISGAVLSADLAGGTATITNVGVFGVDTGTPILNPGEAVILAFGAVRRTPWVVTAADGSESIEPRWVTQLALSFDHRIVDGADAARFLGTVKERLEGGQFHGELGLA